MPTALKVEQLQLVRPIVPNADQTVRHKTGRAVERELTVTVSAEGTREDTMRIKV